jgi:transcriptional regulator with GAF, ATPase, and Fis domain
MRSINLTKEHFGGESRCNALKEITELLYNIDWGNCAVWYVSSMDDYAIFVNSLLQRCYNRNNRAVYIKIGSDLERKLHYKSSFDIYNFEYAKDPTQSINSLKEFIQANGAHISYIFDDISFLKQQGSENAPFRFFRAITSQLQKFESVSYWPLLKGSIVQDTIAKFSGIVQLLVSIERTNEGVCIHPLRVPSERFHQMLKPYSFDFKSLGLEKRNKSSMFLDLLMQKIAEADQLKKDLRRSEEKYQELLETTTQYKNIVGRSEHIRDVCRMISIAAASNATVLIQGESGTGKELVAEAIHFHSLRSKGPFIKVNCAAISETLFESELFGHKKGAFTGAICDRKGRFQLADNGTILLDEIGCMTPTSQAKFLRVLEERKIEPVGRSNPIKVDIRVIATTNLNFKEAMEEGKFREDLYYRLNVFPIKLLPLRERKEDILPLAMHFLRKYSEELKKTVNEITPAASYILQDYDWPGNVRELENAIEYAVMLEKGETLHIFNLPQRVLDASRGETPLELFNLRRKLEIVEKEAILEALECTNWIKNKASKILGINPKNLSYFMKKHNIPKIVNKKT